jgi:ribose transport system permease protein
MSTVDPTREALPRGGSRRLAARLGALVGFGEAGILLALLVLVAFIGGFNPEFLAKASLINVGQQAAFFGIMALGMVFLLSMREVDLSVGSLYGLCAVAPAVLMRDGLDPWLAALAGIGLGVALGAVNGLIANALKLPSIIVTLGTLSMFKGITLVISDTRTVTGLPREHAFFEIFGGRLFDIPASIWALVLLTVVLAIVYERTRYGFVVRSIGSNPEAAALTGMSIGRTRLATLMLTGGLCGVAGVLTLAFFQSADPNTGLGYELLVIAAAIIGGTTLAGGTGTVVGALLGALTIGVIRSGLVQFGVTTSWSVFATGAVIVAAVALDVRFRGRRERRQHAR